jgi:hypothetical protein
MQATTVTPSRPCTACGGLECLCRPRFRAGQVLTETDLNCLEQYVVRKQQRHNLYLHGTGVVCGMNVLCHPCPGWVTVTSGFAIGPCGEEIAIPNDYPLNVCQMIRDCRTALWKNWSCQPFAAPCGPTTDSTQVDESWYVTVRYDEAETRGTISDCNPCGQPGDCGCGGSGGTPTGTGKNGCGCGGHGSATKTKTATRANLRPPADCEPNRICEGYRLEIAPAPPTKKPTSEDLIQGTLLGAVFQCTKQAAAVLKKAPLIGVQNLGTQDVFKMHSDFRAAVVAFLAAHPLDACSGAVKLPDPPGPPGEGDTATTYNASLFKSSAEPLKAIVILTVRKCVCEVILPPCPADAWDPRLVLAVVTTHGIDCKIVDICDVRCRKQLVTIPTVLYWVSIFPALWASLERNCCDDAKRVVLNPNQAGGAPMQPPDVLRADTAATTLGRTDVTDMTAAIDSQTTPYSLLVLAFSLILSELKIELVGDTSTTGTHNP